MNNSIRFSIIIPAYNAEAFIQDALSSRAGDAVGVSNNYLEIEERIF